MKENAMFVVIFEVQPRAERWDDYVGLAGMLRPELVQVPGFIDNERFRSERTEGRILSLSTWADEKSVIRWRTHAMHHGVQEKGRSAVLADYHLRVGEVTSDTHPPEGHAVREQRFDATEIGIAKSATILEPPGTMPDLPAIGADGLVDCETYASITTEGRRLALLSWATAPGWRSPEAGLRQRMVRVIRDYAMRDRREAPQYYPDVTA
jgi:heme-degrading monooxygenase HmoA